jgi:hypothetical protein
MTRAIRCGGIALAAGVLILAGSGRGSAHRTVISNFTFHQDVRPILLEKCGRCHGDGGVAGLPLLRYDEARAASWPIRQALMADRMPPWSAVAGDTPLKGSPALTAREMNVLMTWAAGGTPPGTPQATAAPVPVAWPLGKPDLVLPFALPIALDAGAIEVDREVVLPAAVAEGRPGQSIPRQPRGDDTVLAGRADRDLGAPHHRRRHRCGGDGLPWSTFGHSRRRW